MSKIIEEGPTCFPKTSPEKKHILNKVQLKNAFVTGVAFDRTTFKKNKCT